MKKTKMAILGAGNIAEIMASTITKMPQVEAYAVAARDAGRAQAFADKHGFQKAYGSYEEMAQDKDVELVYIATPHSHHYQHAMLCLEHGKHVLCEKAFTANATQARRLLGYAREKNLLITEAMWPRYMPMYKTLRELLDSGVIGSPTLLTANLGHMISGNERIVEPALAGGALLDLSIYPITFTSMVFGDKIVKTVSTAVMTDKGVDAADSITLCFEGGRMAVLYSTILSRTTCDGIIYGDRGHIVVTEITNPKRIRVMSPEYREIACYEAPAQISGYEYEVESTIRAIAENRLECPEMPHSETLRIMELMDGIRASWGMRYPFEEA